MDTTYITLSKMIAKIVKLHHDQKQRLFLDTEDQDRGVDETSSLYHILRQRKTRISDGRPNLQVNGNLQT